MRKGLAAIAIVAVLFGGSGIASGQSASGSSSQQQWDQGSSMGGSTGQDVNGQKSWSQRQKEREYRNVYEGQPGVTPQMQGQGSMGGSTGQPMGGSTGQQGWSQQQKERNAYQGQQGVTPQQGGASMGGSAGASSRFNIDPATSFCQDEAVRQRIDPKTWDQFMGNCKDQYKSRMGGTTGQGQKAGKAKKPHKVQPRSQQSQQSGPTGADTGAGQ